MFKDLLKWYGFNDNCDLTICRYKNNSKTHEVIYKKYFKISVPLIDMLDITSKDYEYGIASPIYYNGKNESFIRQIDCKTRDLEKLKDTLKNRLGIWGYVGEEYRVYDSGNSFHVYLRQSMMSHDRTITKYLSDLILRDPGDIFDTRWIAHSIFDGMSNLRVTCNTGDKIKIPELVYEERCK